MLSAGEINKACSGKDYIRGDLVFITGYQGKSHAIGGRGREATRTGGRKGRA